MRAPAQGDTSQRAGSKEAASWEPQRAALLPAAGGATVGAMLTSSIERRTAALVVLLGALGGCGARTGLLDGAGAGGSAGHGGSGGPGGAAPVDAGPGCADGQARSCYTGPAGTLGVGVCKAGQQVCSAGAVGPCTGEVLPSPEICDGLDDDCNGVTDEGTCSGGRVCADSIETNLMTAPSKWTFNGSASWNPMGPWAELTPAVGGAAGTMIYDNPIVTDAFIAKFTFTIGGADGLAFMIEPTGPKSVGTNGGGLGVAGLDGYAIELDTYDDGPDCGDPDANHVGLDDLSGTCGMGFPISIATAPAPVDLGDQQTHAAFIQFDEGMVSVAIDGAGPATFAIPGWAGGKAYYYGFGAGTGDAIGLQVVDDVLLLFPTYRCL